VFVGVASDEETRNRHSLIAAQAAPVASVSTKAITHRIATSLAKRMDITNPAGADNVRPLSGRGGARATFGRK
jgi:hypothetical protein